MRAILQRPVFELREVLQDNYDNHCMKSNRRTFIRSSLLTAAALSGGVPLLRCSDLKAPSGKTTSGLFRAFKSPPGHARPFFRWWWNGNHVTREEITRELKLMKDAGFGGVEINPIAMPETAQKITGKPLTWLSEEWIGMVRHTSEVCKKLGMTVDLIVGTGWPFGGEFLSDDETIQGIRLKVIELQGPVTKNIGLPVFSDKRKAKILDLKLFPAGVRSLDDAHDLTKQAKGKKSIAVTVKAGKHRLYILTWHNTFRTVHLGAKGGAGPVLDHFDKKAVEHYLNHISGQLNRHLPGGMGAHIRSMFCDSIELEGANWTTDLPDEFLRRKGYDLRPYLPLLLDDQPDVSPEFAEELCRVRYDHRQVLAELLTERFIIPFHEWCHANGTLSRYQAYGYPSIYTDLLDGYLIPDIPEGDQWLFNDGWQPYADIDRIRYAIFNKYAASGGHLRGRKVISSEAMTNTKGVFEASLEYIRQATDINFCTGVNHLVIHGFNYSPPEAGFPGWVRFGTYFSEHNPWWPYVKHWADYTGRLSMIFQQSQPVSHIAILGPVADIWSDYGLDRNPFLLKPWYLHALWQAFSHLGILLDYISEKVLSGATMKNGQISMGKMAYQAVILCDVRTMAPETASRIRSLTAQGAKIIALGEEPAMAPGLTAAAQRDETVKKETREAINNGLIRMPAPGKEEQASPAALMRWAGNLATKTKIQPDVTISPPHAALFYNQFNYHGAGVFFFANTNRKETLTFTAGFPEKVRNLRLWDADSGTRRPLEPDKEGKVRLRLTPLASSLIVEDDEISQDSHEEWPWRGNLKSVPLIPANGWSLTLHPVEGKPFTRRLQQLADLSKERGLEGFAGAVEYAAEFYVDDPSALYLDPGVVRETSEIKINGRYAGLRWWGTDPVAIKGLLKKGANKIEIKVSTLLFNLMRTRKDDATAMYWVNRSNTKSTLPSGLIGPLKLLY